MSGRGHTADLTRNQSLVFGALRDAERPLSAYTILDQLRENGLKAPLQVYRALDKLIEFGMVHRLESLNAFVACQHPDCDMHRTVAFTICDHCGEVSEIDDRALTGVLSQIGERDDFRLTKATVELRGLCGPCRRRGEAPT